MHTLKTHVKSMQIRKEESLWTNEAQKLSLRSEMIVVDGTKKNSELRQTPPHSGFRELISGLYDLQRSLAATTLAFKRFHLFLYTFLNDRLRLEWKRKLRWDPLSFGLGRVLRHEGRSNRYG